MKYSPFIMLPYEILTWHWDYGYSRFGDLLKIYIFLMQFIHFSMLNARNVHFLYEILTFLLIWGAKMPPESENINGGSAPADPRQRRGRIACWEPKMLILFWFLYYFRIRNEAAQPPSYRIQYVKEAAWTP